MTATLTGVLRSFFPFAFARGNSQNTTTPTTPPKRYERQIFSLRGLRLDLVAESGRATVTAHILSKELQKLLGKDVLISDEIEYATGDPLAIFDSFAQHVRSLDGFLRALHDLSANPYVAPVPTRLKDTVVTSPQPAIAKAAVAISTPPTAPTAIEGEYLPSPVRQPPGATKYKAGTLEYQNADQHTIFGIPRAVFVGYVRAHGVKEFSKTSTAHAADGKQEEGKPQRYPCYHIALEMVDGSVEEIQGQSLATAIEQSKARLGDLVILRQFSSFTSNDNGRMPKKQFEIRFPSAEDLSRFGLAPKKS